MIIKILIQDVPKTCSACLFLGTILRLNSTCTGCTLLKIKIPVELGCITKLQNCPLIELRGDDYENRK